MDYKKLILKDFKPLVEITELCRAKAVSFTLHYAEGSDEWDLDITSAAKAEEREIKHWRFLAPTLQYAIEWLRSI